MVKRGPGERAGLTRTAVFDAARALLAERGLPGVTMRALAGRLGVAPNTLYSHVPGKTELVDALLDDLLAEVSTPDPDTHDPLAGVAAMMRSTYEVLVAHPDLVPLYLARQGARGRNAVRLGEIMDTLLTRAGVAADVVQEARRTLIVHAIGSAAFATGSSEQPLPQPTTRTTFERALHWLLTGITAKTSHTA